MTNKELIKKLSVLDPNAEVAISGEPDYVLEDVYEDTDSGYIYLVG